MTRSFQKLIKNYFLFNCMKNGIPWIIEFKPKKLDEVIGQENFVLKLKNFIKNFRQEKFNAVILSGPTGCGKTASVYALKNELNLEIIEINASDFRNKANIEKFVGSASQQSSLFMKEKVVLVDEIDGLSGVKDRGGLTALAKIIDNSKFPIIMTTNDVSNKKFKAVRKKSLIIEFRKLSYGDVLSILTNIAKKSNLEFSESSLKKIALKSGGDARAAINDLQIVENNGKIDEKDLDLLSYRNKKRELNDVLRIVFKTTDPLVAIHSFDDLSVNYDEVMMWEDENIPLEYVDPISRFNAYDSLSKADIFRRKIRRRQHWRFLVYIKALLSAGVAVAKDKKNKNIVKYVQNSRPLTYWMMNRANKYRDSVSEKLAEELHISTRVAKRDVIPYFRKIFVFDAKFRTKITDSLELDAQEVAWLVK